jgi:hypothetical protein
MKINSNRDNVKSALGILIKHEPKDWPTARTLLEAELGLENLSGLMGLTVSEVLSNLTLANIVSAVEASVA